MTLRAALAIAVVLGALPTWPAPVVAGTLTCGFDDTSGKVRVSLLFNGAADIRRTPSGLLTVNGSLLCRTQRVVQGAWIRPWLAQSRVIDHAASMAPRPMASPWWSRASDR